MMRIIGQAAFGLALVVHSLGCGSADGADAGMTLRDSAGITIVENTAPEWDDGREWRLADRPRVSIGSAAGGPEYELFRVSAAVRLGDGRIVVANSGTNELRLFDGDGRYLTRLGGPGQGPGEFRALQRVWRFRGDSLLAYDFMPARLTVYSSEGSLGRTLPIRAPDGRQVIVRGPLADGTLLAEGSPVWDRTGATTGVVRDSAPFYHYSPEGELLGSLGTFPSSEAYRTITEQGARMASLPFARIAGIAVAGDLFYFAPAHDYEIDVYTATGVLEQRIRLAHPARPVTPGDLERLWADRLEMAERDGSRESMQRMLGEMPTPETMPAYGVMLPDDEGHLWVSDYRATPDERPLWRVFSPRGRYLGTVRLPDGFQPLHIGVDFVLGRWLDELEVEHVRSYELIKP